MLLPFLDTNVIVYAFTDDWKSEAAQQVLAGGGRISVQTSNECVNVFRREQKRDWIEVDRVLAQVRRSCAAPIQLTLPLHEEAVRIAERDGLRIYDALIVATALEVGCQTLLSEDLQNGRVFDSRLTVRNPFATQ